MALDFSSLTTEQRNTKTNNIDQLSTIQILKLINDEDRTVADAVRAALPQIESAVDEIYKTLSKGGKLFYLGAGTSGRLGVVDAAECPPTFSTEPDLVQAIIAGGKEAILVAVEGSEDDQERAAHDLQERGFSTQDILVGIAASGRTPYVIGALEYADRIGAKSIALSCNKDAVMSKYATNKIEVIVGPEILTGSTRMKAATAQKLVLNMLSTTVMIKLGKVYENLMVDVNASNQKLIQRAKNIVVTITGIKENEAEQILEQTEFKVKPAIVMIKAGVTYECAQAALNRSNGMVRSAIELALTN
jgi:N-acetylmuramic acid 6-phosphate etherase